MNQVITTKLKVTLKLIKIKRKWNWLKTKHENKNETIEYRIQLILVRILTYSQTALVILIVGSLVFSKENADMHFVCLLWFGNAVVYGQKY